MGFEYLDQAFVFGAVILEAFQLVSTGAKGTSRRAHQTLNCAAALSRGINQLLSQGTKDAVLARQHFADDLRVCPRGLNDAGSGGVNDRSDAPGLRVKKIESLHVLIIRWGRYEGVP